MRRNATSPNGRVDVRDGSTLRNKESKLIRGRRYVRAGFILAGNPQDSQTCQTLQRRLLDNRQRGDSESCPLSRPRVISSQRPSKTPPFFALKPGLEEPITTVAPWWSGKVVDSVLVGYQNK